MSHFKVIYKNKDIMDKLDSIHADISKLRTGQARTNGKVKLHEKLIWALGSGFTITITVLISIILGI